LHGGVDREGDVVRGAVLLEELTQGVVALGQGATGEFGVERPLGAVGPEGERQVTGDGREDSAFGVVALALELVRAGVGVSVPSMV
jgi:hypothetical protein